MLPLLEGAFSFVVLDAGHVMGVRDAHGFRPLCLGRLGPADAPEGWVLASETPALDIVGATFVREIEPGELVIIDGSGVRSVQAIPTELTDPHLCIFEFVYFARPDSHLYGKEVHAARRRMGERLAAQAPVEADLVMGVPESGVPAAEGFARATGIPHGQALVKNRYIGRTFITPGQGRARRACGASSIPLRENIAGKRIVVVDDTIVRGTTQRAVVAHAARGRGPRGASAHLVSAGDWPCFYGIDIPVRDELSPPTAPSPSWRSTWGSTPSPICRSTI